MSYVPQRYIQQPQSNVILQSSSAASAQPYSATATQYYYAQAPQGVYTHPVTSQSIQIANGQVTSGSGAETYLQQQQQGQYISTEWPYQQNQQAYAYQTTPVLQSNQGQYQQNVYSSQQLMGYQNYATTQPQTAPAPTSGKQLDPNSQPYTQQNHVYQTQEGYSQQQGTSQTQFTQAPLSQFNQLQATQQTPTQAQYDQYAQSQVKSHYDQYSQLQGTSQYAQYYQAQGTSQYNQYSSQQSSQQSTPQYNQYSSQQSSQQSTSQYNQYSSQQSPQQSTSQYEQYNQSQGNRKSQSQHDQSQQNSPQKQHRQTQHNRHDQQGHSQYNKHDQRQSQFNRHDQHGSSQQRHSHTSDQLPHSQNRYNQPMQHYNQSQQNRHQNNQSTQQNRYPKPQNDQSNQQNKQQFHQHEHSKQRGPQQNQHGQLHDKYSQPQPTSTTESQKMQVDEAGSSKQKCSPLNDFGDMGAAVMKYVQSVSSKPSLVDANYTNMLEEKRRTDTNKYRKEHGLVVWDDKGGSIVPEPFEHFEDIPGIKEVELNAFYNAGFQAPTPIQAQTWPIVLKGRDVVSIAKTGSGKTLAFLLPAYQKIDSKFGGHDKKVICVLVLAPTRELAMQIEDESVKFGNEYGHNTACAYGGAPRHGQLQAINAGVSVLVATPGRLNDFLDSRQVNLSSVFYLVLDEADRMLDMGFEPQIRSILRRLPRQRQTLMFSATWPEEVRKLADDFLNNPIHIRLGDQGSLQANENIKQFLVLLQSGDDKDKEVVALLRNKISNPGDSILVFVARKNTCNFVANMLSRLGISSAAMHGDRTQEFREEALAKFKDGRLPVLVATDVASRGIDVKGLVAVVNYDMPGSTEDYVHRIGRTGRAGLTGESYTFLTHSNEDVWKATSIVEVMEKTGQPVPDDVQMLINQLKDRQRRNTEQRAVEDQQFSKVLMVAEKPSVAKMIADSLSNNGRYRTRKGKSRANQIFEFIKWFPPAQQKCKIMITSVVGHIFGLSFENQRCPDNAMLFDAPVKKVIEDTSKKLCIVEHLQELSTEAQYLYLWLDCDREGENIGFEVISLTQASIHYDNVYRARFSSLTKSELNQAYSNPIRPDKYAAMSVDARQELDLKIGVAFTRLMTRTYLDQARTKFRLKDQKCISYGPCQTPTLWFCVQRHKEIQSFEREKYFELSLNIDIQGQDCSFQYIIDKVNDVEEVGKIEASVNSAPNAVITEINEARKSFSRPVGLNTVTLLKACSKGLGMSPTAAMHAAEHLYTCGYISYPRTETTAYSPSFDLVSALEEQANHPNWGRIASHLLNNGQINPPVQGHDAGDHPPITPVKAASRNEITKGNEWRVYDYVTRHFIATLHNDFEYMETKIKATIGGYDFCFTCHDVVDRGFAFAMPWKEKSLNLKEMKLNSPQSLQAQNVNVKTFNKVENYTKPPDYLQESELIALMDKHGIGTDASIPQHIKNVQDRHYVDVCGPGEDGQKGTIIPVKKYFGKNNRGGQQQAPRPSSRHMVPRGFGLAFLSAFEYLDNELCEPAIRSYMEKQITKIATGETDKSDVVSSNLKLFLNKFLGFRQNLNKVDRYFLPKVFPDNSGNVARDNGFNAGGFNNDNNFGNNFGNQGGYDRGRGRGGRGGGRGGAFNNERRGRGFSSGRGKRGSQGYGNGDGFKRQKTWE